MANPATIDQSFEKGSGIDRETTYRHVWLSSIYWYVLFRETRGLAAGKEYQQELSVH